MQRLLDSGYERGAADAEQDTGGEREVAVPLLGGVVDAGRDPGVGAAAEDPGGEVLKICWLAAGGTVSVQLSHLPIDPPGVEDQS
jgi:hypothetical protein